MLEYLTRQRHGPFDPGPSSWPVEISNVPFKSLARSPMFVSPLERVGETNPYPVVGHGEDEDSSDALSWTSTALAGRVGPRWKRLSHASDHVRREAARDSCVDKANELHFCSKPSAACTCCTTSRTWERNVEPYSPGMERLNIVLRISRMSHRACQLSRRPFRTP